MAAEGGAACRPACHQRQRHGQWRRRAGRRVDRPAFGGKGTAGRGGGRGGGSTDLPSAARARLVAGEGRAACRPLSLQRERQTCPQRRRHRRRHRSAERGVGCCASICKGTARHVGRKVLPIAMNGSRRATTSVPWRRRAPRWHGVRGSRGSTVHTSAGCGASHCRSPSHLLVRDLSSATTLRLVRTALPVPAVKRVAAADVDTGFSPPAHLDGHVPNRSLLSTADNGAFLVHCGLLYHDATRWYEFTLCLCMFLLVSMARSG